MKRRYKYIALFSLAVAVASCYNSFDSTATSDFSVDDANTTIAELHSIYNNSLIRTFDDSLRVKGTITANNIGGNLYGSFIMESDSFALEILDGLSASHIRHAEGAVVMVELAGLAMSRSRGVLQVGLPSEDYSYYSLSYLSSLALVESHILIEEFGEPLPIESLSIEELGAEMCGRVIQIENLSVVYDDDELDSSIYWSGYRCFYDESGETIYTYVSSYADFAYNAIQGYNFSITGVLQYDQVDGSYSYILKPRSENDLVLN